MVILYGPPYPNSSPKGNKDSNPNPGPGLPGALGNKGTLAKYRREQGNMTLLFRNRGAKLYKLVDENMVNKFIKRGMLWNCVLCNCVD